MLPSTVFGIGIAIDLIARFGVRSTDGLGDVRVPALNGRTWR